eukprot:1922972-Amphidinium_carterae.2
MQGVADTKFSDGPLMHILQQLVPFAMMTQQAKLLLTVSIRLESTSDKRTICPTSMTQTSV